MRQIALALGDDARPGFDNFVIAAHGSDGNAAAVQALRSLQPGSPPLYLWGPRGSGKTHLLRALAADWRRNGRSVAWFDADNTEGDEPLVAFDHCDTYDAVQQHAAFTRFVAAIDAGATVAAAGRVPPIDLPLRDDLRTRLGWGLVFAIEPLAESDIRTALRRDAERRGLALPDEVLDRLLTRHARDLASLMSMLDRLDRYAMAAKRALTVPLLKQMLDDDDHPHPSPLPPAGEGARP